MPSPTQLITPEFAIELNRNYINTRSNVIRTALGYEDANALWYSIEELENYIAYVKTEAEAIGYIADGIRIYMGAYPNNPEYGDNAGMTNLFLCPTGYPESEPASKSDIADIDPMNMGTMGQPPMMDYPSL